MYESLSTVPGTEDAGHLLKEQRASGQSKWEVGPGPAGGVPAECAAGGGEWTPPEQGSDFINCDWGRERGHLGTSPKHGPHPGFPSYSRSSILWM